MDKPTLIKELQKGLVAWYDFRKGDSVLYVGDESDAIAEFLINLSGCCFDKGLEQNGNEILITVSSLDNTKNKEFLSNSEDSFDFIICIEELESYPDPVSILKVWRKLLKKDGILILGLNNRLGIRYFCGDRDPYTNQNFDGIEAYRRVFMNKENLTSGRCYAKYEIEGLLKSAEFCENSFYSVFTDLKNPNIIYRYGFIPKEDLANRVFPTYNFPDTVFLREETLYRSLIENDMFHQMANAYLVVAGKNQDFARPHALQITSSLDRSHKDAMLTILRDDGKVVKKNMHPEGRKRLEEIYDYSEDLKSRGLDLVDMELTDDGLVMPYIDAPVGQLYLKKLLYEDKTAFLRVMDEFRNEILKSSEVLEGNSEDENGLTLKYGYLDLVPLNSFYIDGHFVFFDQEFRKEKCPANFICSRMIATFYACNDEFEKIITRDELYKRYGLLSRKKDWIQMELDFLRELRNEKELESYHSKVRRDLNVLNSNRESINYPAADNYKVFINIFENADSKKLFLFGSGKFADKFIKKYGGEYPVFGVIDNSGDKQGTLINGIEIQSPEIISWLSPDEYKVIICIKDFEPVLKQLKGIGVKDYSVYNAGWEYPKPQKYQ